VCACIDDTDSSLLYGFDLVCLRFSNQVMPDGGCVFENGPYDCCVKNVAQCASMMTGTYLIVFLISTF